MRTSYQDGQADGVTVEPLSCDHCKRTTPAWALYEGLEGEPQGWICGTCIQDAARERALPMPEPEDPWQSERGKYLKAERNRLLEADRWTIDRDSPLTLECQDHFVAYRALLNRMTVDHTPGTWTWPPRPEQSYS